MASGGGELCTETTSDNGKSPVVPGVTGREPRFQLVNVVANYVKNANIWYCLSVGPDYIWQACVKDGAWKTGATMRTQGTSYCYTWVAWPFPATTPFPAKATFMGGKSDSILLQASRWPMLSEEPDGWEFTGNIADPPASAVPHSGGMNVAYGDGHAKYHHMEAADGNHYLFAHAGDGIYPGQ